MPTKSAIAGICFAALGLPRGSDNEQLFLAGFGNIRMIDIAIPRNVSKKEYLTDAAFCVLLEGESVFLTEIANALADPVWGIWLGRKIYIPTAPVLAGLNENRDAALRPLIGDEQLESFTRQEEVENFSDGRDSLPDIPVSFATERRVFSPRKVRTEHGKVSIE